MDISVLEAQAIDEIKKTYLIYLQGQNLSKNTIMTSYVDAFYLWRKNGREVFWKVVLASDFETTAKDIVLNVLKSNSSGNVEANVNGYLAHLRRFRRFLSSVADIETPMEPKEHLLPDLKIKKLKKILPTPSSDQVEAYLEKWNKLEIYHLQEAALNKLFFDLCPENKDLSDVLLKASTLNYFYSTNIFSIYPVAKHIVSLNIDKRLLDGDSSLVDIIQHVNVNGKEKNFYSFATKYCSHHNPLDFPIYDSYVDEVLRYFRKKDGFTEFADKNLRDYSSFKKTLIDFRLFYHLEAYDLKQIDKYIWQLGKEYFPKNY